MSAAGTIKGLIDKLETYGFQCEAGPLNNSARWIELKRRALELDALRHAGDGGGEGEPVLVEDIYGHKTQVDVSEIINALSAFGPNRLTLFGQTITDLHRAVQSYREHHSGLSPAEERECGQ